MTSHQGERDRPMFTNKSPHFYKLIRDEFIRAGKLPIPKKFVRQYGKLLPRLVNVEVPSGGVWEVEVAKCDCDPWMWLQKGWPEFAKHFSLKCGHFLVFRYQGNAHFHVSIFDKTATEIEYPYVISSKGNNNTWECRKRRRHKSDMPLPCPQPHKKLKSQASAPVAKGKSPALEVRCLKNAEKVEALKKASDFTSKNPFFMLVMQPSCLGFRGRVSIPVSFARENIKIQNATLILSSSTCNGKTWPARYYCMHKKNTVQHLIQGVNWEAFAKDNALQVGDVCVFELTEIMRPQIMLKVSIYPATSNDECKVCPKHNNPFGTASQRCLKSNFVKAASAFKSANPFFTVSMHPSYLNGDLNFSYLFAMRHFKNKNGQVRLRVSDGRTWIVDYYRKVYNSGNKAVFRSQHWTAFVVDNNLKLGDVCVFELIKPNRILLNVIIFPAATSSNNLRNRQPKPSQCPRPPRTMNTKMTDKTEKILESQPLAPCFRFKPHAKKTRGIKLEKLKGSRSSSSFKQADHGLMACKRTRRGMGIEKKRPQQAVNVNVILGFSKLTAKEQATTLHIANSFNSNNPFFLALIRPLNLSRCMLIPSNFAMKFFTKTPVGGSSKAILRLSNRKSWSVMMYRRRRNRRNPYFQAGWKKFALDNRVAVDDICVFELINGAEMTFKVVIIRAAHVAHCDTLQDENGLGPKFPKRRSSRASEAAASRNHSNNIPFFIKQVTPAYLDHKRCNLHIPFQFTEKHFKPDADNVILQVADRVWSAKLVVNKLRRIVYIAAGWLKFASENCLAVGDFCVFKLIASSNGNPVLNVSISRRDIG